MLNEIIAELGSNYNTSDSGVLQNLLEEITADALFISNTSDSSVLRREIKDCVKSIYLQRGSEGLNTLSESGINSSFIDPKEKLRQDIIRNGKRRCY